MQYKSVNSSPPNVASLASSAVYYNSITDPFQRCDIKMTFTLRFMAHSVTFDWVFDYESKFNPCPPITQKSQKYNFPLTPNGQVHWTRYQATRDYNHPLIDTIRLNSGVLTPFLCLFRI